MSPNLEHQNGGDRTDGSLTPTATRDGKAQLNSDHAQHNAGHPADIGATFIPSSRAASTTRGSEIDNSSNVADSLRRPSYVTEDYASSIATDTTLIPGSSEGRFDARGYPRRKSGAAVTKSRKVYMAVCDAVQVAIPMDMNGDATSMRESSLYKGAKRVQNGVRRKGST